jgi:hypothetical protein
LGVSSVQPASSINRNTAALVIWVHLRDLIDSRCSKSRSDGKIGVLRSSNYLRSFDRKGCAIDHDTPGISGRLPT